MAKVLTLRMWSPSEKHNGAISKRVKDENIQKSGQISGSSWFSNFCCKLTFAAQAGLKFNVTGRWFLDANLIYVPLKTKGVLSTGQTIETKLNPMAVSLTLGTAF